MADQPPFPSPFLTSPKLINKKLPDSPETVIFSPVSVLETKNSSPFACCSKSSTPSPQIHHHPDPKKPTTQAIGLALIYSIVQENINDYGASKPVNRMALLGSKLKIQIPAINTTPSETKSPQFSISCSRSRDLIRQLSLKEMELYEDYTCVITHGPHPKTTHIFGEFIVESSDDDDDDHTQEKDMEIDSTSLSFCKQILKEEDIDSGRRKVSAVKKFTHNEEDAHCIRLGDY